ncbi:sensor histidine kinase [Actinomycetospora corticicola]|uniref:histidine kinase n=1 Tax=Actinomycetospora corticicola TaxID=663602 RepID=A0A7Y9DUJ0_9PSEU|nr:sensor histidine kinase [Actinomycetospora corticicola]NYD35654.1 signal transduction histidine kinase [Actinomycetospora corticicola]
MTTVGERPSWLDRAVAAVRRRPVAVDAVLAAAVAAVSLGWATDGHVARVDRVAGLVCAVLFALPVVLRRRYPLPIAVGVAVAAAITMVVLPGVSATILLPVLVIGYSVVVYGPRWAGPVAAAVLVLGAVLPFTLRLGAPGVGSAAGVLAIIGALFGVIVWLLGALRRAQLRSVGQLRERARLLEEGRRREVRLELLAERSRISREVHDIVGHSLSGIIAQADGGRFAAAQDPQRAVEVLAGIADAGRGALGDIRGLLSTLREGPDDESDATPPTVDDVPALVAQVRAGGLPVSLDVTGSPRALPAGAGLTVYRVVQEGLTNVVKHAGVATPTRVTLAWGPELEVAVRDDGPRGARPAATRDGYGLLGMRERAALQGGSLDSGPRPDGGFAVRLRLPLPAAAR